MPANYASKYLDSNGLLIYTQTDEQQKLGYQFISLIRDRWNPRPYYYHLQPGGHVAAARSHLHHQYFARTDLKKFFYNVTRRKVSRVLGGIGINYESVQNIVAHSIVLDQASNVRHVPFGFVQSPLLATLALHKSALGAFLKTLSHSTSVTMSIYMDDILLSSDSIADLQLAIDGLLKSSTIGNFPINQEKLVLPCAALEIFNIELSQHKMEISAERLQEFEGAIRQSSSAEVIHGIISYVHTVNNLQAMQLESLL